MVFKILHAVFGQDHKKSKTTRPPSKTLSSRASRNIVARVVPGYLRMVPHCTYVTLHALHQVGKRHAIAIGLHMRRIY